MEKSKPVVVGIGELLWDVFPDGSEESRWSAD